MVDKLSREHRSANMSRIASKNTKPELQVRRLAHALRYRYRIHVSELPGKPDLVFSSRKKAIFVHGCFWHQHPDCREGRIPDTRKSYWQPKLERNVDRDRKHIQDLKRLGWKVLVVWECEVHDAEKLEPKLTAFLGPSGSGISGPTRSARSTS